MPTMMLNVKQHKPVCGSVTNVIYCVFSWAHQEKPESRWSKNRGAVDEAASSGKAIIPGKAELGHSIPNQLRIVIYVSKVFDFTLDLFTSLHYTLFIITSLQGQLVCLLQGVKHLTTNVYIALHLFGPSVITDKLFYHVYNSLRAIF